MLLSVLHPHKNNCPETATKVVPALQRGLPVVSNVHVDRTIRSRAAGECETPSHCAGSNPNSTCLFVCGEARVDSPEAFATAVCSLLIDNTLWSKASRAALDYSKLVGACMCRISPPPVSFAAQLVILRHFGRCRGRGRGMTYWIR